MTNKTYENALEDIKKLVEGMTLECSLLHGEWWVNRIQLLDAINKLGGKQ